MTCFFRRTSLKLAINIKRFVVEGGGEVTFGVVFFS